MKHTILTLLAAAIALPIAAQIVDKPPVNPPYVTTNTPKPPFQRRGFVSPMHGGTVIEFAAYKDPKCTKASPCPVVIFAHGDDGDPAGGTKVALPGLMRLRSEPAVWVSGNGLDSARAGRDWICATKHRMRAAAWMDKDPARCRAVAPESPQCCLQPLAALMFELVPLLQELPFVDSDTSTWTFLGHSMGGRATWLALFDERFHDGPRFGLYAPFAGAMNPRNPGNIWLGGVNDGSRKLLAEGHRWEDIVMVYGDSDCGKATPCPTTSPANHYRVSRAQFDELARRGVPIEQVIIPGEGHSISKLIRTAGERVMQRSVAAAHRAAPPRVVPPSPRPPSVSLQPSPPTESQVADAETADAQVSDAETSVEQVSDAGPAGAQAADPEVDECPSGSRFFRWLRCLFGNEPCCETVSA